MTALITQFFTYLDTITNPINAIIVIAIFVLVFILLREFFCWYLKINDRLEILKKIERHLAPRPEHRTPPGDDEPAYEHPGHRR